MGYYISNGNGGECCCTNGEISISYGHLCIIANPSGCYLNSYGDASKDQIYFTQSIYNNSECSEIPDEVQISKTSSCVECVTNECSNYVDVSNMGYHGKFVCGEYKEYKTYSNGNIPKMSISMLFIIIMVIIITSFNF